MCVLLANSRSTHQLEFKHDEVGDTTYVNIRPSPNPPPTYAEVYTCRQYLYPCMAFCVVVWCVALFLRFRPALSYVWRTRLLADTQPAFRTAQQMEASRCHCTIFVCVSFCLGLSGRQDLRTCTLNVILLNAKVSCGCTQIFHLHSSVRFVAGRQAIWPDKSPHTCTHTHTHITDQSESTQKQRQFTFVYVDNGKRRKKLAT